MKKALLTIALIVSAAGPAAAAHKPKWVPQQDKSLLHNSYASVKSNQSFDVIVDGRVIGRDPDPAVRRSILQEHFAPQL